MPSPTLVVVLARGEAFSVDAAEVVGAVGVVHAGSGSQLVALAPSVVTVEGGLAVRRRATGGATLPAGAGEAALAVAVYGTGAGCRSLAFTGVTEVAEPALCVFCAGGEALPAHASVVVGAVVVVQTGARGQGVTLPAAGVAGMTRLAV